MSTEQFSTRLVKNKPFGGSQAHCCAEREIPNFRIRKYSVNRLIPNRTAASLEPATTHFVCFRVLQVCVRSASSSVTWTALRFKE